jgi:chorismate mutase
MTLHNYQLDLNYIASRLESLEETIISKLIDRAQFCVNENVYEIGKSGFAGESNRCLFDVRMHYHEQMDAGFGRFCVPEERPFTRNLPSPKRQVNIPETGLHIDDFEVVNFAGPIRTEYMKLIKQICLPGDDGQYGSSVEHDVYAIQAISRRIHYGAFYVAECKYMGNPETFSELIDKRDISGLLALITRKEVEENIINRVYLKTAETQKNVNRSVRNIVDPEAVVRFYRDAVIPLTKEGEIAYLLNRIRTGIETPTDHDEHELSFKW